MATEGTTGGTTATDELEVGAGTTDGSGTNDHLVRVGGVFAIVGSIVSFAFIMIRPHTAPADPIQQTLRTYASEISTFDLHSIGLFVGFLLLLGGFVGLEESLRGESGAPAAWGRLGLVVAVVMTATSVIFNVLDTRTMPRLARAWVEAPAAEKTAALGAARGAYTLDVVMVSRLHTLMVLTFLLFAVAVWQSDTYHRWLGWSGVAVGVVGVALGAVAQLQGIAPRPARLRVGAALVALFGWFVFVGVSMWRASGATPEARSES